MVFGWGKKKEEKKEERQPELPQQKEISIDTIPKIVDDILYLRTTQTLAEIKSLRNSTEPLIKELAKIGQTLEKDNLEVDDIDKHIRIIVVRGKKQVIDVIKKDVTDLPDVSKIEDAQKLSVILGQILKKVGDVLGRQTRVIHIFAKKYAEKLKEILEQMNSNHSEIVKLIRNYEDTKKTSEEILEDLKSITDSENEIKHNKQRISELQLDTESIKKRLDSLKNSISEFKSSEAYTNYLHLEKSLKKLSSEKSQIKNQIDSQFTKISRPLGRYEYVSSDKEQKSLLTKLVEDPTEVLVSKNKDLIIVILENIRKGILSGSISVKDVNKSMIQITETVEMLDSFIKQVDEFQNKVQNIKQQMDEFDRSKLLNLENDFEKASQEKYDNDQKILSFENEIKTTSLKIPQIFSSLESKLRQFSSTKYTLKSSS